MVSAKSDSESYVLHSRCRPAGGHNVWSHTAWSPWVNDSSLDSFVTSSIWVDGLNQSNVHIASGDVALVCTLMSVALASLSFSLMYGQANPANFSLNACICFWFTLWLYCFFFRFCNRINVFGIQFNHPFGCVLTADLQRGDRLTGQTGH